MQIKFELAKYDDTLDKFELDENLYQLEISEEDAQTYELLKSSDLTLYNWLMESDFFLEYIREEVYPNGQQTKFAICDINDLSFRRFFFFKVTSGDSHYEYFKKLFDIFEESDWQDREEIGEQILAQLQPKRLELLIDLTEDEESENDIKEPKTVENDGEV
ncbi:MAG: Unknown protein [uncultured Sulfurovum sp.]|uniref:Uncharacterized protein n=1 Tax=uncultured Sulfurovum sp. TaxID=269237 RepID=A0A6S6SPU9_9BACT|nr:MAG: Unknown protein [uncultured Sulfurovum sp.]